MLTYSTPSQTRKDLQQVTDLIEQRMFELKCEDKKPLSVLCKLTLVLFVVKIVLTTKNL